MTVTMTGFNKVLTTHLLLFLVSQTLSFPQPKLKKFIRPTYIKEAKVPFASKYIYADKTKQALELLDGDDVGETYFFVRPRRFGKSTFLRTLQRIFDGSKHIFEGTHIYQSDYNWDPYPILYLDLGRTKEKNCGEVILSNKTRLVKEIREQLGEFIKSHKLFYKLSESHDVVDEFLEVLKIVKQEKGNLTVVLIDEYDLPVLSNMKDCPAAEIINKGDLEDLFVVLKKNADLIKFAFVTGVSRAVFRMFISPPDLKDITDIPKFHEIAGITDTDLNTVYANHITDMAKRLNESNVTGILKHWYDGYQFANGIDSRLYSPLSVHGYFESEGVAKPYYDDKGHAEFIFDQMVKRPDDFSNLDLNGLVRSDLKGGKSLDDTQPEVLLYDAGYLTIQIITGGEYYLGFPNKEMELAFHKDCAVSAWHAEHGIRPEIRLIGDSLKMKEPEVHTFMKAVNTALMKMKIRPKYEQWYQHETRNFMDNAKILYTDVETRIETENFGKRFIDITGYDKYTCFLFEAKMDEYLYVAWEQTNKSKETVLIDDKLCPGTKNLLAAGITFSTDVKEDVLLSYQAKLFAPNGEVLQTYQSKQYDSDGSILQEYLGPRASKTDFIFSRDDLFEGSTRTDKPLPTSKKATSRKSRKTTKRTSPSTL